MTIVEIVLWIALGALAGWIASLVTGTDESQGSFGNVIVGIVGAFLGGLVIRLFGATPPSGFSLGSILTAVLGAVILLSLLKGFRRSRI